MEISILVFLPGPERLCFRRCLSVCLSVSNFAKTCEWICTKFSGQWTNDYVLQTIRITTRDRLLDASLSGDTESGYQPTALCDAVVQSKQSLAGIAIATITSSRHRQRQTSLGGGMHCLSASCTYLWSHHVIAVGLQHN